MLIRRVNLTPRFLPLVSLVVLLAAGNPTLLAQSVSSLTLINADSDEPVQAFDPLVNGATINLATLPTRNLNVRANTSPSSVGSVRFGYDSNANYAIDNSFPYSLGDSKSVARRRHSRQFPRLASVE